MVHKYAKGLKVILSEHFTSLDFDCHCTRSTCTTTTIDSVLVESLEALWAIAGPFAISSGFRCNTHNAEEGGAPGSMHLRGRAADCHSLENKPGFVMARLAEKVAAFANGGIGIYPRFVHVDVRLTRARWGLATLC